MRSARITRFIFLVTTLILFGSAGFCAVRTHSFIVQATRAEGRVVKLLTEPSRDGGHPLTRPVVEFSTADGTRVEFTSTSASYPPSFARDETVTVFYEQSEPQSAEIDSFFSLWGGVVITSGLCVVFAGFTAALYLRISFAGKKSRCKQTSQAKS